MSTNEKSDLDEMAEWAELANPGPWRTVAGDRVSGTDHLIAICGNGYVSRAQEVANTRYIACANPTAVLSLIQRIRELERDVADANAHVDELHGRLYGMLDEHDRLALNQASEARHMRNR